MAEVTKKVPSEIEAEKGLLGCVILDQELLEEVIGIITKDDFFEPKHVIIYSCIENMFNEHQRVDLVTLASMLEATNKLDQAGGSAYLGDLVDKIYNTDNLESYIKLIQDATFRRMAIQKFNDLSQLGYNQTVKSEDYSEQVEKAIFELQSNKKVGGFKPISVVARNVNEQTNNAAKNDSDLIGLNTGFSNLNKITQGLQPGALIILAARPAMGKSAFALNLATNIAKLNHPHVEDAANTNARVAFFSLEMSAEQLVERMIASEASIPLGDIKNGKMEKTSWIRFNTSCKNLEEYNIFFDDASDTSVSSIRSKCRKLKTEDGLDAIIIDYLQLISSDKNGQRDSEMDKVTKISRSLKLLARELEVPVIALSQLSRDVEKREDKHPTMADLRSSGSIEQDADIVMFLYRDDYYNKASERKGEADLIISKNRSGSTTEADGMPFYFQGKFQRFTEKKKDEE